MNDYKDKLDKSENAIRPGLFAKAKRSLSDRTNNIVDHTRGRWHNTDLYGFTHDANGKRTKLPNLKYAKTDKFKSKHPGLTALVGKIKKIFAAIQKAIAFIISNAYVILIITGIVLITSSIVFQCISMAQASGASPHYYCDLKPDDKIKDSELYKQYCVHNYDSMVFSSMNGHYIVQDGKGPAEACAVNNMLLRFWYLNDFNWYDTLWTDDGQYPANSDYKMDYYNSATTFRQYIIGGGLSYGRKNTNKALKHSSNVKGSLVFAQEHKSSYTSSNWGYVRDNTLKYKDGQNKYADLSKKDKWVWDLSAPNGTSWDVNPSTLCPMGLYASGYAEVEVKKETTLWKDKQGLIDILYGNLGNKNHAEGIVVVFNNHSVLVTGYDPMKDTFTVIDSGLGMLGGFEGPATSSHFCCIKNLNEKLSDPFNGGVQYYWILDPKFESKALATNGYTHVGDLTSSPYPYMMYSPRKVVYNAMSSPYAERIVEYAKAAYNYPGVWYKLGTPNYASDKFNYDQVDKNLYKLYDCSGLVGAAVKYATRGKIVLGHSTRLGVGYGKAGIAIPLEEIEPGDILYFSDDSGRTAHHTGIYIGKVTRNGKTDYVYIHACGKDYGLLETSIENRHDICEVVRIL